MSPVSEIKGLDDDGFEGSENEQRTCRKVYFGKDGGRGTKRCLVTGVINFENDYSKHEDMSLCSNSGNSAITCQEDPREKSEHLHPPEEFKWAMRDDSDVRAKRMKLSVNDLSSARQYLHDGLNSLALFNLVNPDMPKPATHFAPRSITCRIVESARQGVSCSCYLLKKQKGMDLGGGTGDDDLPKCKLSHIDGSEQKEPGANKVVSSPVSQESSATKILVSSPAIVATGSGCRQASKPRWKESCFVELDEAEMSLSRDSKNDPRPLLRYHINHLLKAAGWAVGRRKRSNSYNGIGEYVYKSPEGRPIRQFHRAWNLCGQDLFVASGTACAESDVKEWNDLTQFWSDLKDTSMEIEKMDNRVTSSVLAHCWYLLDPFAKVVFIDKLFSSLKSGKVVQAKRGFFVDNKKGRAVLTLQNVENAGNGKADGFVTAQPCGSSPVFDSALAVYNEDYVIHQDRYRNAQCPDFEHLQAVPVTTQKGGPSFRFSSSATNRSDIKCLEIAGNKSSLGLLGLQGYGSDSSSDQIGNDLYDVPISAQDANLYPGSESVARYEHSKCVQYTNRARSEQQNDNHVVGMSCKIISNGDTLPINGDSAGSGIKSGKRRTREGIRQKKSSKCPLNDDDLLISAIIKNKSFKSATKQSKAKRMASKSKSFKKRKNQKGRCRLLPQSFNRNGMHYIEGKCSPSGSRTVLSWLIKSGIIFLDEVIQYRDTKDDTVVKDGLVTWDGILCKCCDKVLSVSEFKSHAGFKLNRPCLNLFMESGKPFTLCQLEAWSAEYKARKSATRPPPRPVKLDEKEDDNDDSCGFCGGEGKLICCDNCPSTYHQACLPEQEIPKGDWYCSHCTCQICGDVVDAKKPSESPNSLACYQCEHKYHGTCLKEKGLNEGVASEIWFCGESCSKVYSGLRSRVGIMNLISDGFAWTLLRCIHSDKIIHSAQRFVAFKAECNLKLAVALTIMEECFVQMVDPRTGIDMIPHVLYNWGSQFTRLNYHGFYTVVLEKNDVLMSVASIRIHGATVAEMPLIATCSRYRRQGMCRHLMNAVEEMLRSLNVETLVISAVPDLVETWTQGFGFERLEDDERRGMQTINLMVLAGTVWLKKSLSKNQATKEQQTNLFSASPSEKDGRRDSGTLSEGHMVESPNVSKSNFSAEEVDVNMEVTPSNDNIEVDNDQDKYLDIRFKMPSCEEKTATSEGNQLEVVQEVNTREASTESEHTEQLEQNNVA